MSTKGKTDRCHWASDERGLVEKEVRSPAISISLPDPAGRLPAFSIVPTDREAGTGYLGVIIYNIFDSLVHSFVSLPIYLVLCLHFSWLSVIRFILFWFISTHWCSIHLGHGYIHYIVVYKSCFSPNLLESCCVIKALWRFAHYGAAMLFAVWFCRYLQVKSVLLSVSVSVCLCVRPTIWIYISWSLNIVNVAPPKSGAKSKYSWTRLFQILREKGKYISSSRESGTSKQAMVNGR